MDFCLKCLHVLGISPVKQKHFSPDGAVDSTEDYKSKRLIQYLTMPAALPLALAWVYRFLATVFSFTEPTNVIPFTFLQQKEKIKLYNLYFKSCLDCVQLGSHGEVGDESSFGDLDIEADALGFGARVDDRAPDGGVGEA